MKTFKKLLVELDACGTAIEWAKDMPIEEVVSSCHRGDWLLWLARRINIPLKELTLAKGHCAATVLHLMRDQRSKDAVQAAIDIGEGKINREQLNAAYAASASYDIAYASAEAAAAHALNGSTMLSAASPARKKNQLDTAEICRKYIGSLIIFEVNKRLSNEAYFYEN